MFVRQAPAHAAGQEPIGATSVAAHDVGSEVLGPASLVPAFRGDVPTHWLHRSVGAVKSSELVWHSKAFGAPRRIG